MHRLATAVLIPSLAFLFACRGGNTVTPPVTALQDTPTNLRLTPTPKGAPEFLLHWRWTSTTNTPATAFRILQSDQPPTGNPNRFEVRRVDGNTRSAPVTIPADTGILYLTVELLDDAGNPLASSKTLALDTSNQLAFQVQQATTRELWLADDTGSRLVASNGDNFHWTPGSRLLSYTDRSNGLPRTARSPIWDGKQTPDLIPTPSFPDRRIPVDWFSLRVSTTGSVAFRTEVEGQIALFTRQLDGTETRVSAPGGDVLQFAWSPDGQRLVYLQQGEGFRRDAFVTTLTGERQRLNGDLGPDDYVFYARWSTDSQSIAWQQVQTTSAQLGTLTVTSLTTQRNALGITANHESSWSGSRLYFTIPVTNTTPPQTILAYYDGTQATPQELTRMPGAIFNVRVAKDGSRLAFLRRDQANQQTLYLLDIATRQTTELTIPERGTPLRHTWAPIGRKLAVYARGTSGGTIHVFDLEGSTPVSSIWLSGGSVLHFAWSPFRDELAVLQSNPTTRLYRTNGARTIEVSANLPAGVSVLDMRWADWGMPSILGVFSTLVSR